LNIERIGIWKFEDLKIWKYYWEKMIFETFSNLQISKFSN